MRLSSWPPLRSAAEVLRTTIRASENTDVEAEVRAFGAACRNSGLPSSTCDLIAHQLSETLSDLVRHGRDIAAFGSHMDVTRTIAGEGYEVAISFGAGKKFTILRRIVSAFRGR